MEIYKHEWHKKNHCKYWPQEEYAEFIIDRSVTNFLDVKEMIQGNLKDTSVKLQVEATVQSFTCVRLNS